LNLRPAEHEGMLSTLSQRLVQYGFKKVSKKTKSNHHISVFHWTL
jgi:hypothetical protein